MKLTLTVVVLGSEENFIQYLNPELLQITENNEQYALRTISTEYNVESIEDYKKLFKLGNKLWVHSDGSLNEDVLYVMNTNVEKDLFEKNNVIFEAEEKLVELNYIYFNPLKIADLLDSKKAIEINFNSLNEIFGDYFSIGIVQDCLTDYMNKLVLKGTMSLMEVLRYIEEETGNVFKAQYEKDVLSNDIHCSLNFLNPKSTSKKWELHLFYEFPTDESNEVNNPEVNESEDIFEKDDIVTFPEYVAETRLVPENLKFRLTYEGKILYEADATEWGFTGEVDSYEFIFNYSGTTLNVSVNNQTIDDSPIEDLIILNGTVFEMYDKVSDRVVYAHSLYPKLFEVHEETLDLGYNVENITYDVNEEDTFMAIAPVLQSDELTYDELNEVIQNWQDLEVHKGETVPMIVQKRTITGTDTNCTGWDTGANSAKKILGEFHLDSNYWVRPVKRNDSEDSENKSYEVMQGTAYWQAPFTKLPGELFVADETLTGIEYTHIQGNRDNIDESSIISTPKIGSVETSDTDPYAIFNDVCRKLKDKRYPEVNIGVDVANLKNGKFNNYNIFDQVSVKIPGFDNLVIANVLSTEKNPLDVGENKVELTNYSANKKVAQRITHIESTPLSFTYPSNATLTAKLINEEYDNDYPELLHDKLLSFTVYSVENETETFTGKVYTKKTDNGEASINLNLLPGNYIVEIQFPGDAEYAASNTSVNINVYGTYEEKTVEKTTVKVYKSVKTYYSNYGVSPDEKKLIAIGKKSSGNTFYVTTFERKCPHCGSKKLYWSIYWAGNETKSVGVFPIIAKKIKGSHKGRIVCKKCEHVWDALGDSIGSGKNLKVSKKSKKSSKTKAYELKNGNRVYGTTKKEVAVEKVVGNTGATIPRDENNTGVEYSGLVSKAVKDKAKNIVGNSTGIAAAKKLAKWCGKRIKHEKREGLYQSPKTTLNRKRGNCLCQTDLFLQMCDAVGVTEKYELRYIHVGTMKYGKRHFFARINGVDIDVDAKPKNPWGHASYKGRTIYSRKVYPELPIKRKYKS